MRKNILILLVILACFWLLPFKVSADIKGCEPAFIELKDIEFGGKGQNTTYAVGGIHFITPTINITWYESSDGSNYTLMEENATFDDYNVYYKAVLDTSYDELNGGFDEEGWELCGLSLEIVDEDGNIIDSKSYNGSSNIEYVFEPFWKYKVYLHIDDMDYIGPTEIIEGEKFEARLVPKKNYRLPYSYESYNINILIQGNKVNFYDFETGDIEIESWHINGDINIYARAEEKTKIEFKNGNYIYTKNSLELSVEFNEIDKLYINDDEISESNYSYDSSNDTLEIYDTVLDKLETGNYKLRIENNEQYAETTFEVRGLELVESIIIDFRKISNSNLLTRDQLEAFQFLGIDKGFLTFDASLNTIGDRNQKVLLYMDSENNITLANNLSSRDNIVYTLTEEELETYKKEYAVSQVPKKIIMIFGEGYKVTLDANGGKFTSGDKYIIDNIINFDYLNFNKPTREGYEFIGFFTEKTGGKSFEEIMNSESGIESDMTFYARWEETTSIVPGEPEEENPKTYDGIGTSIFIGTISLIGLVGATFYLKRKSKVRA